MASLNKVQLIGYLGGDPEVRFFPSGDKSVTLNVSTTDKWKDKETGELREATEWHTVRLGRRLAEIAATYLTKGALIYIEGAIKTESWEDKNTKERRSSKVIRGAAMQMLHGARANAPADVITGESPDDDVPL